MIELLLAIAITGMMVWPFILGWQVGKREGYREGLADGKWNVIGTRSPWHR